MQLNTVADVHKALANALHTRDMNIVAHVHNTVEQWLVSISDKAALLALVDAIREAIELIEEGMEGTAGEDT